MENFLRVQKSTIVSGAQEISLRGINLGGWLMMEGYILHSPNRAEQIFKKDFSARLGQAALTDFERSFRDNFVQEKDFSRIAALGMNCVRLPFNSRLVEKQSFKYDIAGAAYLDRAIRWAKKYRLRVILDLHAGSGAQNHDWHSDSLGTADLWQKKSLQDRTIALWEFLADRYRDEKAVAGYDILNEPVLEDMALLNRFYGRIIKSIRSTDRNHILFIEGSRWAQDIGCLDDFDDDNIVLSAHHYNPLEFTFNFVPQLSYPLRNGANVFGKAGSAKVLDELVKVGRSRCRPVYIGEFGVNARKGLFGEDRWLQDVLECFNERKFHWTYWTFKAVKNAIFPDGIYSYYDNPAWVNRAGPQTGWETYAQLWTKHRREISGSWRTENFKLNPEIAQVLKTMSRAHA